MKRHELIFSLIKIPLEICIILGSFFIARILRLKTDLIPNIQLPIQTIETNNLLFFSIGGIGVFLIVFFSNGLYNVRINTSKLREFLSVFRAMISWFFIYIALLFLSKGFIYETDIPRLILFFSAVIGGIGIIFERWVLYLFYDFLLRKRKLEKRSVILIIEDEEKEIFKQFDHSNIYEIIGYIGKENKKIPYEYLGSSKEFGWLCEHFRPDEIFFVNGKISPDTHLQIFEFSQIYGARFSYISNIFKHTNKNTEIFLLGDIPMVGIENTTLTPWGRIIKRTADIGFSLFLGIICFIPVGIIGIICALQSKSTPLYTSKRVGKNGKIFSMYKLRSMYPDADLKKKELLEKNERTDGPLFKIENDPRITPIGRWVRKWDIDELPQILNVLMGNMSFIGPRPHLPDEVEKYKPYQKRVLTIKPGITGMAQVHGRHKNSFEREVLLDIFYIENWSSLLDVKIFFQTIKIILFSK